MPQKITPLGHRLLVKPTESQAGALIIPDGVKEKPQIGTVIEVGPGTEEKPMVAKSGDSVFYRMGAGIPIPDGYCGEHAGVLLMTEGIDILAVITE